MTQLGTLSLLDLRPRLPRAAWSIGRLVKKDSATIHYNGPAVATRTHDGEIRQLIADAHWHMRPDAFGPGAAGDGLMYHLAVLSDGTLCQCRDLDAVLWHCANVAGNAASLAIHLPLGGAQDATEVQWHALTQLLDTLATLYRFDRAKVFGHTEWPKYAYVAGRRTRVANSACPGPNIMRRLKAWREGNTLAEYTVLYNDANVREGPGTRFPVALGGKAVYKAGQMVVSDGITLGEYIGGSNRWIHFANGIGFIHSSLVRKG